MALTKEISKVNVSESAGNKRIVLRLIINDDGIECARREFDIDYKPGADIQAAAQKLKDKMQAWADEIVADRNLYHHSTLDTAVTWLNNNIIVS